MYECFKASLILQTSIRAAQTQMGSCSLTVLPIHCLQMLLASSQMTGVYWQVTLRLCWKEVMWWVWKIFFFFFFCSCFCLSDQLKLWRFSCPDSFCSVWEAKQVDLVPSQGIQRLIVLVSGRPSKEDNWTLGKDFYLLHLQHFWVLDNKAAGKAGFIMIFFKTWDWLQGRFAMWDMSLFRAAKQSVYVYQRGEVFK